MLHRQFSPIGNALVGIKTLTPDKKKELGVVEQNKKAHPTKEDLGAGRYKTIRIERCRAPGRPFSRLLQSPRILPRRKVSGATPNDFLGRLKGNGADRRADIEGAVLSCMIGALLR